MVFRACAWDSFVLAATDDLGSSRTMLRAALSLTAICFLVAPGARAQTVVLAPNKPIPANAWDLAETTTIELKDGKMQINILNQAIKGAANALLRDRITRTFKGDAEQEIEFHESTRSILFSFGGKTTDPKLSDGQLAGKKIVGKREEGGWKFKLKDGKPTSAEESALKQFSAFNIAVESMRHLYGDEPREVGKPWRPDFSALSRVWPGISVTIDCRIDEVAERDGEQLARITVGGLVKASYGEHNRVEVSFTGSIIRSLRDHLDVETGLNGTVRFRGVMGKADEGGGGNEATIEAPLSLRRTVKVMKRRDSPR